MSCVLIEARKIVRLHGLVVPAQELGCAPEVHALVTRQEQRPVQREFQHTQVQAYRLRGILYRFASHMPQDHSRSSNADFDACREYMKRRVCIFASENWNVLTRIQTLRV